MPGVVRGGLNDLLLMMQWEGWVRIIIGNEWCKEVARGLVKICIELLVCWFFWGVLGNSMGYTGVAINGF